MSKTLKHIIYETIHRGKTPVAELADHLGIGTNHLYRMGNPTDDQARIPADLLLPLMTTTRNYAILEHLAHRCGFLLVSVKRVATNRKEALDMAVDYQELTSRTVAALHKYLSDPDPDLEKTLKDLLSSVSSESWGIRKSIEKNGQLELI